ncbi:MAG: hypothetical protein F6K09_09705 [Merismopedia sp. SIO2A8]|nr:hypothetical protein [Symploca sp. SIO2B6]NET48982.1 hypothetical protein [Merismopedia sp. SIO2A8]
MSNTNQPWMTVEDILQAINEFNENKPPQKIGILGAGMAGLVAAYELLN